VGRGLTKMIPFVVCGAVKEKWYGHPDVMEYDDIRIVMATDMIDAGDKYQRYWDDKCVDLMVSYDVHFTINDTLLE
jgi:hypothetical protein